MDANEAISYANNHGKIPMMSDVPFGVNRYDPSIPFVRERDFMYETRECDVCGRKFASFKTNAYRNCCDVCTQIWTRLSYRKPRRMKLFYYHTKLRRALGTDIHQGPEIVNLTPAASQIFAFVMNFGWCTIADISRETGLARSTIADAINGCMKESNLLLKKTEIINKKMICKWNIEEHVIYKKMGCPICQQHYFKVNQTRNEMMCVSCRSQWKIKDNENFV